MTKIVGIEQLKTWCAEHDGVCQCFIALNFGAKSSKDIHYDPDERTWRVFHNISDAWSETYRSDKAFQEGEAFLFEAMEKRALFTYQDADSGRKARTKRKAGARKPLRRGKS